MTNRIVSEVRYDLASDIARLDGASQIALLDLGLVWAARNRVEVFDLVPYEVREELDIDRGWGACERNRRGPPKTASICINAKDGWIPCSASTTAT